MQNHAEKLADRLVAPTLALATGTAAITADFNRFLSLVIVDYGTGIRVAAPTAVLSSMTHRGARRHHHQERPPYGAPGRRRHRPLRQDRHADARPPAVVDIVAYQRPHRRRASCSVSRRRRKPGSPSGRRRPARQGARNSSPTSRLRRAAYRLGLGVEGQVNGHYSMSAASASCARTTSSSIKRRATALRFEEKGSPASISRSTASSRRFCLTRTRSAPRAGAISGGSRASGSRTPSC